MPIERQKLILIAGVVLGVLAIVMVKVYLDQQQQIAQEQAKKAIAKMQTNQTAVLIAKQDIPKGALIESVPLDTAVVPNKFVQPQAVTSLSRISGMVTVVAISKGEQITLSKLVNAKQQSGGDLAGITPAGKRAISVAVDNISSVAGMVRPGDYVDVIATIQIPVQGADGQQGSQVAVLPLFQNVLVLAVGHNTGASVAQGSRTKEESVTSGPPLVTLALSPQESSFIAFVQEQGKIRFTLRSPADAKVEPIVPANLNTLFQYILPQSQGASWTGQETKKEEPPPVETIEIYRGVNKERMPISK